MWALHRHFPVPPHGNVTLPCAFESQRKEKAPCLGNFARNEQHLQGDARQGYNMRPAIKRSADLLVTARAHEQLGRGVCERAAGRQAGRHVAGVHDARQAHIPCIITWRRLCNAVSVHLGMDVTQLKAMEENNAL